MNNIDDKNYNNNDNNDDNKLNNNEFVMTMVGNKIIAGGYKINSNLLNDFKSPISTYIGGGDRENELDILFKNSFAIPAGLYVNPINILSINRDDNIKYDTNNNTISDDIYDKLIEIMKINNNTKTKKNNKYIKSKTKKKY